MNNKTVLPILAIISFWCSYRKLISPSIAYFETGRRTPKKHTKWNRFKNEPLSSAFCIKKWWKCVFRSIIYLSVQFVFVFGLDWIRLNLKYSSLTCSSTLNCGVSLGIRFRHLLQRVRPVAYSAWYGNMFGIIIEMQFEHIKPKTVLYTNEWIYIKKYYRN